MSDDKRPELTEEEEYGATFITLVDEDDGTEIELELLDTLEFGGETFAAFYADDEENPDEAGVVIMRVVEEDGMEAYETVDDEQLVEQVYEKFMENIGEDEE